MDSNVVREFELGEASPGLQRSAFTAQCAAVDDMAAGIAELAVVVPCLNERGNIEPLVDRLHLALAGVDWEVIFVDDDSGDGTREAIRLVAEGDRHVRLLHRIGRRGLASACVEGIQASLSPYVAIMDADLQHDETLLPRMLECLRNDNVDVVVGSRYVSGGSVGSWDSRRVGISAFATRIGRLVLKTHVADPMSGFFMLRRATFNEVVRGLSALGFKILVDILATARRPLRVVELPFSFRPRISGESKLSAKIAWEFIILVADKLVGHIVPVRFLMFSIVGGLGVGVTLAVAWVCLGILALPFAVSQAIATGTAMVVNFVLNNILTYRDRPLRGWRFLRGLASFALICSAGAIGNVGVANFLFHTERSSWWLASTVGIAVGSVWNYAVSSVLTWRKP
jgi:dolichol-phosphate mannosyltransferase